MGSRGRKSATELTTISGAGVAVTRRPEPPEHLGEEAASVWRAITNGLPADWLSAGALPLLEALCGLTVSQRYILRAIQVLEHGAAVDFNPDEWAGFIRQHSDISGRIASLSTKLRLTPQARYTPGSAATAAGQVSDGPKPWET